MPANSTRRSWDSPRSPRRCPAATGGGPLTRDASWAFGYNPFDAGIIDVLR